MTERSTHPHARSSHAHGSALLFVLVAVAVVLPTCVGLARAVTTAKVDRALRLDEQLCEDLLREVDAPIQEFLVARAPALVLPADARFPAALVLKESLTIEREALELTVVAWDQCGLVSIDDARRATPMRLALPRAIVATLDRHRRKGSLPGLDWFREVDGRSPFPPTPEVDLVESAAQLLWPASTDEALGAFVATHNPGHLNVSTAPITMVEAALRDAGRGGLEEIVAARTEGRRVPLPSFSGAVSDAGTDDVSSSGERFVSTSDAWAFRVDVRVGRVRRSDWVQYRPNESRWRCVQRITVTD